MKVPTSLRVCAVTAMALTGVLIAQALKPPFRIDISPIGNLVRISPMGNLVRVGDGVGIRIVVTNTSFKSLTLWENGPDIDYDVNVLDSHGVAPPDTERGREVRDKSLRSSLAMISSAFATVEPDKTLVESDLAVDDLYDMSRPGRYTIQVQRHIPPNQGRGVVKSNTITVTVTE
jgi:hypothetical protein